jgi:RNA polymerase sigma factor (sigma-70 family)
MVVRAAVDEVRRPWRRERSAGHELPEVIQPDVSEAVTEEMRVRLAVRRLPPGQRAVLVLRFYADLSVDDTAEALGLRPGTVSRTSSRPGVAAGAARSASGWAARVCWPWR